MRKLIAVLSWRAQFAWFGRHRVEGGILAAWAWSGDCWPDYWDERCGMNCPRHSFREELYTASLEA